MQVPASATMLTGGVGYTYSLSSAPPLVQTNVPGYPWTPNVPADGKAQGGLSVPAPNVWKVATGFTGRRAIVDNARCKACHGFLGVAPNFHAGQRNDEGRSKDDCCVSHHALLLQVAPNPVSRSGAASLLQEWPIDGFTATQDGRLWTSAHGPRRGDEISWLVKKGLRPSS